VDVDRSAMCPYHRAVIANLRALSDGDLDAVAGAAAQLERQCCRRTSGSG